MKGPIMYTIVCAWLDLKRYLNKKFLTVYFKNGSKLKITKWEANQLREQLVKGCGSFQVFSNPDNAYLFINVSEINYIK